MSMSTFIDQKWTSVTCDERKVVNAVNVHTHAKNRLSSKNGDIPDIEKLNVYAALILYLKRITHLGQFFMTYPTLIFLLI